MNLKHKTTLEEVKSEFGLSPQSFEQDDQDKPTGIANSHSPILPSSETKIDENVCLYCKNRLKWFLGLV